MSEEVTVALPEPNSVFPPREWEPVYAQFRSNDAWMIGDLDALNDIYSTSRGQSRGDNPSSHYNTASTPRQGNWVARMVDRIRTYFVGGHAPADEQRTIVHSMVAGNLASLSADTLMAEPPTIRLTRQGEALKGAEQDRFDEVVNTPRMHMSLIQAAEYAAGMSAVALTVQWDADHASAPRIGFATCDAAVPEWEGERLTGINLWTEYQILTKSSIVEGVVYHVERHEPGRIVHALYLGGLQNVGVPIPFDHPKAPPALAYLADIPGSTFDGLAVALATGTDRLTAAYWRNLPTRRFRKIGAFSLLGRADIEGAEHILDQIDMALSSLMRDVKLGRAQLFVPSNRLDDDGGDGPSYDDGREIITSIPMLGGLTENETITAQQFAIRAAEHQATLLTLLKELLQHAGYSLASYGEHDDVQKTATEVVDRTTATERTRDKKALYFIDAFVPLLEAMMDVDRAVFGGPGIPEGASIDVVFPEMSQIDPEKQARVFSLLRTAMAASTDTLVRMLNPEWDAEQVSAEVARIVLESGLGVELDPGTEGRSDNPADNDPDDDDELPEAA